MNAAEHILTWAENSAPHYRNLQRVSVPGNFQSVHMQASAAFNLATLTARDMTKAGDLSRMELEAADILEAAKLFIAWERVR